MPQDASYEFVSAVAVTPSDRLFLVIGDVSELSRADLISPNRQAKQLKERLGVLKAYVREFESLRWSRGWPGTEGPWGLKVEVVLKRKLSSFEPSTARLFDATDAYLVDRLGVRAFTVSELDRLYSRRPGGISESDSGKNVPREVLEWLIFDL
jgi:hypothetical protein